MSEKRTGQARRPGRKAPGGEHEVEFVAGVHPVLAALTRRGPLCRSLAISSARASTEAGAKILAKAEELGIRVTIGQGPGDLRDQYLETRQGVTLKVALRPPVGFKEFAARLPKKGPALLLAVDHVEDPRNLGALARSAAAFGALGIIVPKDRESPMTDAARAASAGASEYIDLVRVANLPRTLADLKKLGFWAVAAQTAGAASMDFFDFPERCVLVVGSEGGGIGQEVGRQADMAVSIELVHESPVNSLNVSCAGAVIMSGWLMAMRRGRKMP